MKNLIFDFDGTIVDSLPLMFSFFEEDIKQSKLTRDELRNLSSRDVIKRMGVSPLHLPKLILKVHQEFKLKIVEQPIFPEMEATLKDLKSSGFSLHIVSSNSRENIVEYLKLHKLEYLFDDVSSFFTIFGKAHGLQKLLTRLNVSRDKAMYIGDETRDIEAAKKVGIKSLAVTWGYNTEHILSTYAPDYIARHPKDLISILKV